MKNITLKFPENIKLKSPDLKKAVKEIKKFFFVLRSDKEAQIQTRTMALGILVCFALYYCVSVILIEPMEKKIAKKTIQYKELKATAPEQIHQAMMMAAEKLTGEKNLLQQKIDGLAFKEQILREHWESIGDEERFTKVLLTLIPNAPISMEKNILQATTEDSRVTETFTMYPMTLTGQADFIYLFNYLHYIEGRPEVGGINNISIESLPTSRYDQDAKVKFTFTVSRLSLKERS